MFLFIYLSIIHIQVIWLNLPIKCPHMHRQRLGFWPMVCSDHQRGCLFHVVLRSYEISWDDVPAEDTYVIIHTEVPKFMYM